MERKREEKEKEGKRKKEKGKEEGRGEEGGEGKKKEAGTEKQGYAASGNIYKCTYLSFHLLNILSFWNQIKCWKRSHFRMCFSVKFQF